MPAITDLVLIFFSMKTDKSLQDSIKQLHFLATCSMKVSQPKIVWLDNNLSDTQKKWNCFRVTVLLTQYSNTIKLLASGGKILPNIEAEAQFLMQNIIVRLAVILDDKLDEYININNIAIHNNPTLNHRIDAVSSRIDNATKLHDLRVIRNKIGHLLSIDNLDWDMVINHINEAEASIYQLNIIDELTKFDVARLAMSSIQEANKPKEKFNRYLHFDIKNNDALYAQYEWKYCYW